MLEAWLESAVGTVWNYPVVGLCLFAGVFFTLRMAFIQLRCLPHAIALVRGKYDNPDEPGQITHFQALSAALSGTIGLGNIAGVAIAIAMGGPGAVFWMWIIALLGMATKYAECALGTIYRVQEPHYEKLHGGPMYYITRGLGPKWWPLATFFAFACAIGSFGFANMFQANQVSTAMSRYYNIPDWLTGVVLAGLVAMTVLGGIKRIGAVAGKVVPAMCGLYLLSALWVCLQNIELIPYAHGIIIQDAFTGHAAAGGAIGTVLIMGVRRAVFSNEAGMGSAPIAHAAVKTSHPIREGIVASLGPLIDTIVVCTATAMVIILSGSFGSERYEAVDTTSISSETAPAFLIDNGWTISDRELPPELEPLREFREGKHALVFSGSGISGVARSTPLPTTRKLKAGLAQKNLKTGSREVFDALRFSEYHDGSQRQVQVTDQRGNLLGSLALRPEGDSNGLFSIDGCHEAGRWHSHIISLSADFQKQVRDNPAQFGAVQLGFSAGPETSYWAVDRLQSVNALTGVELTAVSFDRFFGGIGGFLLTIAVFFFCYSTMITWSYYGETAAVYLFGYRAITPYRWFFVLAAFVGSITQLTLVLNFADLMSGLMVVPNVIAILLLSPVVVRESKDYFRRLKAGEFEVERQKAASGLQEAAQE